MGKLENKFKELYNNKRKSNLVEEYEKLQEEAQNEYINEIEAIKKTDPYRKYTEIISRPSPRGAYMMNLRGYPIDVNALENYLVFRMTPRSIVTAMRYSDARSLEEFKGYTKYSQLRSLSKASRGLGILLLVAIGAIITIFVGYLFINGTIPRLLSGLFGGLIR